MPEDSSTVPDHAQPRADGRHPTPPSVPDHQLLRRIGQGAYGEVWLARNVVGTLRAAKVVYRDAFTDTRPYEREFEGIQKFEPLSRTHEGLVDVLQIGLNEQAGYFYYVMELADAAEPRVERENELRVESGAPADSLSHRMGEGRGEGNPSHLSTQDSLNSYSPRTLASDLKSLGRLPFAQCLRTALALADALEHLHQQGLIHRDIKPSNIIFVNGTPKLADIGLVTETGAGKSWVGTEGFMPPEGPGTAQGDVYSLGKVLYEISTGKDRQRFPEPLTALADLPDQEDWLEFNEVVAKACQGDPKRRYASAADLRGDLALLLGGKSVRRLRRMERAWTKAKYSLVAATVLISFGAVFQQWRLAVARERATKLQAQALMESTRAREQSAEASGARRQLLLNEVQMARQGARSNGWFDASWEKLREVARLKVDDDTRTQAAACLSGLDARLVDTHTNSGAFSLAFAPDGQTLLCAGVTDKKGAQPAHLWRSSRREEAPLSLGKDQSLLTSAATNQTSAPLPLPVFGDAVAAWMHDGVPVLFQPGDSNNFVLRNATNGQALRDFPLAGEPRQGNENHPVLALAPDARYAAASVTVAGGSDSLSPSEGERPRVRGKAAPPPTGSFAVWDSTIGHPLFQTNEPASALAFSPDGSALAVGDSEGRVRVFSVPDFAPLAELPNARMRINCFAFTKDPIVPYTGLLTNAWWLAVGDSSGTIRTWRSKTGELVSRCSGSEHGVFTLAFHPDGVTLASAGRREVRSWDCASGALLLRAIGFDYALSLAFVPDGSRLAVGNQAMYGGPITGLWQLEADRGIHLLRGLASPVSRVWFSPDGLRMAALAHNWQLAVWQLSDGRLLRVMETPHGDTADNAGVAFHPDGERLVLCTGDEARQWNLQTGQTERRWQLPWGLGDSLCYDARGRLLILRRESPRERQRPMPWTLSEMIDNQTWRLLHAQDDIRQWQPEETALMPDGKHFTVWGQTRRGNATHWQLRFFETGSGTELWRFDLSESGSKRPGLDPTGHWLLHHDTNGSTLRALPGGERRDSLPHRNALSPDANLFASLTSSRYVVLLGRSNETASLTIVTDAPASGYPVFSHDGRRVACGLENGFVQVTDLTKIRKRLKDLGLEANTP